jgi:hypothetical protein
MLPNRRDRGVTQTPFLIVAIVIALISILVAYVQTNAKNEALLEVDVAKADTERQYEQLKQREITLTALAEVVGYTGATGEAEYPNPETIRGELDRTNKKLTPVIEGQDLTCELIISNLIDNMVAARDTHLDLRATRDRLSQEVEATRAAGQAELQAQRDATKSVRGEKDTLQQRFDRRVTDDEEMINQLRAQLDATRTQLEQEQGKIREQENQYKEQLARLRTRITELTQIEVRRTTDIPDGQVIRGLERDFDPRGEGYAFIYIDIGRKHGVKDGTKFEVFALEKGGRRTQKGTLVVKKSLDDMAECAILDQLDERNPIVRGDFVQNPFFEKGAVQHFSLVGTFDGENSTYTKEEWARIVKEHGHKFQTKILANTNFVILGTDPQDDTAQWNLKEIFGVEPVTEREVLSWFDYGTYSPREGTLKGH